MFIEHLLAFDKVHTLIGRTAPIIAFLFPTKFVWWMSLLTLMCWCCLNKCPLLDIEQSVLGRSQMVDEIMIGNSTELETYATIASLMAFLYIGNKLGRYESTVFIVLLYLLKNDGINPSIDVPAYPVQKRRRTALTPTSLDKTLRDT
jgi:hypothetical protein